MVPIQHDFVNDNNVCACYLILLFYLIFVFAKKLHGTTFKVPVKNIYDALSSMQNNNNNNNNGREKEEEEEKCAQDKPFVDTVYCNRCKLVLLRLILLNLFADFSDSLHSLMFTDLPLHGNGGRETFS